MPGNCVSAMKRPRFAWWSIVFAILLCNARVPVTNALAQGNRTALEYEQVAVYSRRSIPAGMVELVSTYTIASESVPRITEYTLYFEGLKYRIDQRRKSGHLGATSSGERKDVFTPERYLRFVDGVTDDGKPIAVVAMSNIPGGEYAYKDRRQDVFDPRALGMVPTNLTSMSYIPMDDVLTRADRIAQSVSNARLDGVEVLVCEHTRQDGAVVRAWISPGMNNSVLKITASDVAIDGNFTDTIECEMKQWDDGGLWFPRQITYQRTVNERVTEKEEIRILNARFMDDLDDRYFELRSMDIPPGRLVIEYPRNKGGVRMWDGDELVVKGMAQQATAGGNETIPQNRERTIVFVVAVNFAIISAFLAYFIFVKKRKKRTK